MKKELEDKLFEKYPKIFRQKDLSIYESCMGWGIETPDGWYIILDILCRQLQWDIDNNNEPQLEASQVKEKWNGLRFYTDTSSDRQDGMIRIAEIMVDLIERGDIIIPDSKLCPPSYFKAKASLPLSA